MRSDLAIRRHWQLVCCAFSFCRYHHGHSSGETAPFVGDGAEQPAACPASEKEGGRGNIRTTPCCRPGVSRPVALRQVRAWLEPWIMLWRYWRGWSSRPPPLDLPQLLDRLFQGGGIDLYVPTRPQSTKKR